MCTEYNVCCGLWFQGMHGQLRGNGGELQQLVGVQNGREPGGHILYPQHNFMNGAPLQNLQVNCNVNMNFLLCVVCFGVN